MEKLVLRVGGVDFFGMGATWYSVEVKDEEDARYKAEQYTAIGERAVLLKVPQSGDPEILWEMKPKISKESAEARAAVSEMMNRRG